MRFTFVLLLLLPAAIQAQTDDSVWINNGIKNAIASGSREYVLPAGEIRLANPIFVPENVKGFTLRGQGANSTIVKTPYKSLSRAIEIGRQVWFHNNSGVANEPSAATGAILENAAYVRPQVPIPGVKVGSYVYLYDTHKVVHTNNYDSLMNHGELAKVERIDSVTGAYWLDKPVLSRPYGTTARVSHISRPINTDITVSGMSFDLAVATGGASSGALAVKLTDGVTLRDITVRNYAGGALLVQACRNVVVDQCHTSGATLSGPGQGYGFYFMRSRFITITNSSASAARQGFVSHCGTTDMTVLDSTVNRSTFDSHGMDERRISYIRCRALDGAFNLGNSAWLAGAKDTTLEDCEVRGTIWFNANVDGARIIRGAIYGSAKILSVGAEGTYGPYGPNMARNIVFSGTEFVHTGDVLQVTHRGQATLENCRITVSGQYYSAITLPNTSTANLRLVGCEIQMPYNRWTNPIKVHATSAAASLGVFQTKVITAGTSPYAVVAVSGVTGRIEARDNHYTALGAKELGFVSAPATTKVSQSNNTLQGY